MALIHHVTVRMHKCRHVFYSFENNFFEENMNTLYFKFELTIYRVMYFL